MTLEESATSSVARWSTISVTPLPLGYVNEYEGEGQRWRSPCLALLLQQLTETETFRGSRRIGVELYEPPYATRVVYADDDGFGELLPALDLDYYEGTRYDLALFHAAASGEKEDDAPSDEKGPDG